LFAGTNADTGGARDVETGFIKRLALTPMQRMALLFGQLIGVMCVAFFSAIVYLIAGFIAGMDFKAGALGVPAIILLGVLIALGFAAIGAYIGLRSGSGEAVQGVFPLLFVFLFLSSVNLPRNLIEQDWFRTIATYNPVSYLVEGVRSLIITGWDGEALALGFGIAAAMAALAVGLAAGALRTRLIRT
jgi:ABC-2 type transport system permease protein